MPKLRFSVPYNNDFSLLKKLVEMKNLNGNKIEEIYFSGPQEYFGSGRIVKKTTIEDIIEVIKFCKENGIKTNLLLNSTCEGLDWYSPSNVSKVLKLVKILHLENGLDGVIIANPLFIQKIRKEFPKLEISASVLSQIDSVQRAMFFSKFGSDIITPDRDINRNLELLKEIKEATNCELKLLMDECCLFKCPYRIFHKNYTSHYSKTSYKEEYDPFSICRDIEKIDPSQLLKSPWIRPEDTEKYKEITNLFKIEGRTSPTDYIIKKIKSYLRKSSENNPVSFFKKVPNNFFEKVTSCDKNCFKCGYCDKLAKKIIERK